MKVYLGPHDVAGILWGYKKGLNALGVDAKVIVHEKHPFGYPADVVVKFGGNRYVQTAKKVQYLTSLVHKFDVFHFVFGNSLLRYNRDVPFLRFFRKKIVMSFLGSDIRCSEEVLKGLKKADDCHDCHIGYKDYGECRIEEKIKLVKFWARNADAIFSGVTNTQILDALSIEYYPVILPCDLNYWKPFEPDSFKKEGDEILILHAPSKKGIKGEKNVVDAVRKLMNDGFNIDFKLLTNVPNYEVRKWLNISDIVVDQLLIGWHGMFSVESMAMAKPTVCFINQEYKKRLKYAEDLPLVNASPDNLYEKLRMLIENPNLRKTIGHKSRNYVERVHDCKKVARHLVRVYSQTTD